MNCPRCDSPATTEVLQQFGGVCPKCVLDFAAENDAPSFPNLEILSLIGEGGMGAVYKARQTHLDRAVALKTLSPQLSGDPEFVTRFEREAKALASLNHPNIVAIHDYGVHDGVPYLVMEYVEGTSLRKLLAHRKLPAERAMEIVPQICDALHYAHSRGVVHRDIKPENILIDPSGRVKIADFGLAKLASGDRTRLTRSNLVMGTPHYMAPEQTENPTGVDHRADIYSLGVVFYEMLTGELPMGRFKAPSEKAKTDPRLDPVVLKSLEKEPDARYQRVSEVKEDVTRVGALPPPSKSSAAPSVPPAPWARKAANASLALAILAALINFIALILMDGDIRKGEYLHKATVALYRVVASLASVGAIALGFLALAPMATRGLAPGAGAAVAGILLAATFFFMPLPRQSATTLGFAVTPIVFAGVGAVLWAAGRATWTRIGGLGWVAILTGSVSAGAGLVAAVATSSGYAFNDVDSLGSCSLLFACAAVIMGMVAWLRGTTSTVAPPAAPTVRRSSSAPDASESELHVSGSGPRAESPKSRKSAADRHLRKVIGELEGAATMALIGGGIYFFSGLWGAIWLWMVAGFCLIDAASNYAKYRIARATSPHTAPEPSPRVSLLAIAALVLPLAGVLLLIALLLLARPAEGGVNAFALVSLLVILIVATAAVSVAALSRIRRSGGLLTGRWMALTGLGISTTILAVLLASFFFLRTSEREKPVIVKPPKKSVPELPPYSLSDVWHGLAQLPEGLSFSQRSEGREALSAAGLPERMFDDLAEARYAMFDPGSLELVGLRFRSEVQEELWWSAPELEMGGLKQWSKKGAHGGVFVFLARPGRFPQSSGTVELVWNLVWQKLR